MLAGTMAGSSPTSSALATCSATNWSSSAGLAGTRLRRAMSA